MWCPNCESEKTRVVGTNKSYVVERYRKCSDCGYTFSTLESHRFDPKWSKNSEFSQQEADRMSQRRIR
ncbi:hypothetical protein [Marinomonas balearica]|uniref:Transcriptional repressor NrdR n=1 Tax=Marinomonas balearica TaxID=491947 RepID=A0A4R6M7T0_9GAMM|nr:hypothetical protein [Marinomonas balearica]TDO97443.1 transcriptional repressor NrdR [Marinomonas balearica]